MFAPASVAGETKPKRYTKHTSRRLVVESWWSFQNEPTYPPTPYPHPLKKPLQIRLYQLL